MDKYEYRRTRLRVLLETKYNGVRAALATDTGIDPSYISRLLYPNDKPGRKRMGEDTVEKIEKRHKGWFGKGYLGQFEYFLNGMSEEHKEQLLEYANHLYSKDNQEDKAANPYPVLRRASDRVKS